MTYQNCKRIFDLLLSISGLVFLSPFMLIISVLVWKDSPGPILYKGLRMGKDSKLFHILKFRTMVENAEVVGGPTTGLDDPRITRLGRLLRKYKLDELPQLLNVLRGEMSIVGPRPEVPKYALMYSLEEKIILSIRPGITDYASVHYYQLDKVVGAIDPEKNYAENVFTLKNALRVKYVKDCSFITDSKLILCTLLRMIGIRWNIFT